jgi:hypothetical protein
VACTAATRTVRRTVMGRAYAAPLPVST